MLTPLLALALVAAPRPLALAIVPVILDGPSDAITSVHVGVDAAAAHRAQLRPIRGEEAFALGDLGTRIEDCGGDDRCLGARLAEAGAKLGLIVVLSTSRDHLGLELIDTEGGRSLGKRLGAASGAPLATLVEQRAAELFEAAGYARWGRARLLISPSTARVLVDEEPALLTGTVAELTLRPGEHRVLIECDDHTPQLVMLVVEAGQTVEREVELVADEPLWTSPWLWTGVGAVAVGAGVALVVALLPATTPSRLCVNVNRDACD